MTTEVEVQTAIETRLRDQWPTLWDETEKVAIVYENTGQEEPQVPYLKFFIRHGPTQEQGYGGGRILYRRFGAIVVQCFTSLGSGVLLARKIAAMIGRIFEGQKFSGVTCREAAMTEVGPNQEGEYQVNVRVEFDYDQERVI